MYNKQYNNTLIMVKINNMSLTFEGSEKIAEYFKENLNIKGVNEQIQHILTRPHLIKRILRAKISDVIGIKKESTKDKYLNIEGFDISRVSKNII